ncbi:MAG: glycosyltransferase family 4 protein [Candidatus Promineifilaceae bacterium]|nr:glycosyltransferase family 4 protein [Candidatus Promineifilaceae bacterium]
MTAARPFTVRLLNTYEPVTTFYRDLVPHWLEQGWRVEVVMSRAEYRPGREKGWAQSGARLRWTPGSGLRPDGRWRKRLIMLLYALGAMVQTLLSPTVDRNLFLTQPPLFYLWGAVLRALRGQPYFVVLMDLHPDLAVRAGLLPESGALTRLLRQLAAWGLRRADGVIVIGRCMRREVLELGLDPQRVHFIPNWADEETIVPVVHTHNRFRAAQGWNGRFVVLYSGNMGAPHFFDDILEASRRLQACRVLRFVFIGRGRRLKQIARFREIHGLQNVELLPFQPFERLPQSLGAADLHFVSLRPGFEGLVVPSKAYGILAAGRPLLYQGSEEGELAQMIAEEHVGWVVPAGDPQALQEVLLSYLRRPELAAEQGRRARRLAESTYGKQNAIRRYTTVLSDISGQ